MNELQLALPGVSRVERLYAHFRFSLLVSQAPTTIEVKVYEDERGRYRLAMNYRPVQKPKPALKAKGMLKSPFELVLEGPYPSVEIGLGELMREVMAISAGSRQAAWEANPHF